MLNRPLLRHSVKLFGRFLFLFWLNHRHSNNMRFTVTLVPQVIYRFSSVLFMICVCQVYSILNRVNITSCCLVKLNELFHLSVVCFISLNLFSLNKNQLFLRRKYVKNFCFLQAEVQKHIIRH